MARKRIALCPGTFDPFTNGHQWMIEPMLKVADQVVLAIGSNPGKTPVFSLDERMKMLVEVSKPYGERVMVGAYPGKYQIDYAKEIRASLIFRGLRDVDDYTEECENAEFNYRNAMEIAQVYLIPPKRYACLSSSKVKDLIKKKGWEKKVKSLVPGPAYKMLLEKYNSPLAKTCEPEQNQELGLPITRPVRGVYVSRFDPYTNVHEWMLCRATELFDETVIGISKDAYKFPTFTKPQIKRMLESHVILPSLGKLKLEAYTEDHRTDFAKNAGAQATIRDIKDFKEFLFERKKVQRNYRVHPEIAQYFIIPPHELTLQTSKVVKKHAGGQYDGWEREIRRIMPHWSANYVITKKTTGELEIEGQ